MINNIDIPENTEQVLKIALEMEEEGFHTYTEGAKKVKNSLGKRMLERLARDEIDHMKRIREAYEVLEGTRDWKSIVAQKPEERITFQNIFSRIKSEISDSIDELGSHEVDDVEIIETAINLENHARFFYREASKKAKEFKVKEFLDVLANEEESHYQALRNINNFMSDPSNWFATHGKF
jgi:rubrerythrin